MVTKEIQKESSHNFSDAAVASRELQQKGVNINEDDISINKKILLMDHKRKVNVLNGEEEEIQNPDITKEHVIRTLDSDRSSLGPTCFPSIFSLVEFQDIKDGQNSRPKGVLVEQNGTEYIYPVKVTHTVHVDPSDPIIEQEYYIKADSKSEAEDIKNDITESKESYLESDDTDVVLTNATEVPKHDDHVFNYDFCFLMSCFWGLFSGLLLLLGDPVSVFLVIHGICAFMWFMLGVNNYYDSKEKTTEFRTTNINRYVSGVNADRVVEEYVDMKKRVENVNFEIEQNGFVRCTSQDSGVTWTLSENGIVPKAVVSALEKSGFSNLDSPSYRVTMMPAEIAEDKDTNMISDCRDWYLDMDSVDPIE